MRPFRSALCAVLAGLFALPACAQNVNPAPARAPGGPCAYVPIDASRYGMQPFRNPPEIRSANGVRATPLVVQNTNPASTSLGG